MANESNLIIKTGAGLNRHNSKQDYETPDEFLTAVIVRFGKIGWDLAATADNAVTMKGWNHFYGPGSPHHEDSLAPDCMWMPSFLNWLNPPYANIADWAKKADESGVKVLMLVPASVGSEWFAKHVNGKHYVLGLRPRLTFKGTPDPYPKDLMLVCFNFYGFKGFDTWRWK